MAAVLNEPEGPSGKLTITYYKPEQLGSIVDYGMRASYGPTGKVTRSRPARQSSPFQLRST